MKPLEKLHSLGQSIWYDNVERGLIESGEMKKLIDQGVRGVTSNPTIFEKAIVGGNNYDAAIREAVDKGLDIDALYDHLVFHDIQSVADLLKPVYDASNGVDGYVSLEVSPKLSDDAEGTVREALRLKNALQKDNLMVKVPATAAGIKAIRELIAEGVNVNVTLIFGQKQYADVLDAYISGLEERHAKGLSLNVHSVASFFVSRVDGMIDKKLAEVGADDLQGKAAVANAKLAYRHFVEVTGSDRWKKLASAGAHVQRPLWASTSTKNPSYPNLLYVDTLVGPDTVNTVPPATLEHILAKDEYDRTVDANVDEAFSQVKAIEAKGILLEDVAAQLLSDGLESFAKSFDSLMDALAKGLQAAK